MTTPRPLETCTEADLVASSLPLHALVYGSVTVSKVVDGEVSTWKTDDKWWMALWHKFKGPPSMPGAWSPYAGPSVHVEFLHLTHWAPLPPNPE